MSKLGYHRSPTVFITNNVHEFMCEKTGHNFWGTKEICEFLDKEIVKFNECDNFYSRKSQYCLNSELKEVKKFEKWIRSRNKPMPKFKILKLEQ